MKVVSAIVVPSNDNIATDAEFQLTEEYGVREVAVVADLDRPDSPMAKWTPSMVQWAPTVSAGSRWL